MRLSRLDLTRYGLFTDGRIDFGPRVAGRPDLHVVYGPNESGKSTTLSAMLDLLFGIEVQSTYDFLHGYKSMAVGARIDTEAGSWEAVRVKRRNDSLVGPTGAPIDDGFLTAALSGLDRDDYRMMFSLDDATLEEGGEAILASRGDLGRVLFSATAGLTELHDTIASIRTEVDGFHKLRGRSGELANLKARLLELKKRKDEVDTVAAQHARLVSERLDAQRAHAAARDARIAAKARVGSHRGVLSALPHFAVLASARPELEGLASLPEAPPSWTEELPGLLREEVELATKLEGVDDEVAELEQRVGSVVVDEAALSASGEMRRLPDLRSRHSDATDALPGVRASLEVVEGDVAEVLRDLGQASVVDPRRLLPPTPVLAVVSDITATRSGVVEALRRARDDVAKGEASVAEARDDLGGRSAEVGSAEAATVLLVRSASDAARGGGHGALVAAARRSLDRRRALLGDALLALRPWEGDLERLAAMVTPAPADVAAWRVALAKSSTDAADAAEQISKLEEDRARLRAEADAASVVVGSGADDPGGVRGDRELAWATHRVTLDPVSADAFERTMRRDDAVTSARIGHEAELSRLRQLRERVDVASAAIGRAVATRDRALADVEDVRARVTAAATAAGGAWDGAATPAWIEGWLSRRSTALDLGAALAEAETEALGAAAAAAAARAAFAGALAAATVPHDPEAGIEGLAAAAQAFLDDEVGMVGRRRRLAELERELAVRRRSLAEAERDDEAWEGEWARVGARCWFGGTVDVPGVVEVRAILEALARLAPRLDERDRLVDEVRRLERDAADFVDEVARVARLVPHVDAAGSPSDASRRLEEAARVAVAARDDLATATEQLRKARARRDELLEATSALERRRTAMTSLFSVDTLAEVGERLASVVRRRELRAEVERAERHVVEAIGTASLSEAEGLLRDLDREGLKARLSEDEVLLEEREREETDAYATHRRAIDKVAEVGGDEEVARIAEARSTILLEIEEKAAASLRLRMGVLAAEKAIDLFRDEHKSELMSLASESFSTLSDGAYVRLTSRSERNGETLIALTAAGKSKTAAELSRGTRFQLYLALRVAAYKEYVRSRPSVPFIADDILETFDDQRTREALAAFAHMAENGQVIYLTHHPHVCRIASAVCPDVRIHELAPLPVG